MKESLWIYLLLGLGIFIIVGMMLIQDLTSTSEEDFYLTKEVLEASMMDAIDYGMYAQTHVIRMNESKFVESFIRRFAESVNNSKDYNIKFYDIYEYPPKATVVVSTKSRTVRITTDTETNFDILTRLSGVIETKPNVTMPSTEETSALLNTIDAQAGTSSSSEGGSSSSVVNPNPTPTPTPTPTPEPEPEPEPEPIETDPDLITISSYSDIALRNMIRTIAINSEEALFWCVAEYGCDTTDELKWETKEVTSFTRCNLIRSDFERFARTECPEGAGHGRSEGQRPADCGRFSDVVYREYTNNGEKHMSNDDENRFKAAALNLCETW